MPRRAPLFPALSQRRIAERLCAWSDPGPARYPAPLLLAFHGLGQHAGLAERGMFCGVPRNFRLQSRLAEHGCHVLWAASAGSRWWPWSLSPRPNNRDLDWVRAALAQIAWWRRSQEIDLSRVIVCGFSAGANFALLAAGKIMPLAGALAVGSGGLVPRPRGSCPRVALLRGSHDWLAAPWQHNATLAHFRRTAEELYPETSFPGGHAWPVEKNAELLAWLTQPRETYFLGV